MNYGRKTLQLIYSKYEEAIEMKEDYLKEWDKCILVGESSSTKCLYNKLQHKIEDIYCIADNELSKEIERVAVQLEKKNGCIVFPYFITEEQRTIMQQYRIENIIECGMEYFTYIVDSYLEKASLFDIGSNGIGRATSMLYTDEESCRVAYYRTCGIINDTLNMNAQRYQDVVQDVLYDKNYMQIGGQQVLVSENALQNEIEKYESVIMKEKAQCIIPLGKYYSYLWLIPVYMKQIQPAYTMKLVQGGCRYDETYLIVE